MSAASDNDTDDDKPFIIILRLLFISVDAVYAVAHAIHNIIKDKCGETPFHECDEIQPAPLGIDLLRYIHNVTFVGRQNTTVGKL